jgi:AbrB family looped-hinge helix DNA binding protein
MSKADYRLTRKGRGSKVSEAAIEYIADRRDETPMSTISTKNQITLPVHLLREMGLEPGDRLAVARQGNRLILRPRPRDWVRYYAGSLRGLYGTSKDEEDAYLHALREDTGRDQALEEAWAGREPASEQ